MNLKGLICGGLKDNLPRLQKEREEDLSRWQAWCGSKELLEFYDDEESL